MTIINFNFPFCVNIKLRQKQFEALFHFNQKLQTDGWRPGNVDSNFAKNGFTFCVYR
jgi:hypothetical protein